MVNSSLHTRWCSSEKQNLRISRRSGWHAIFFIGPIICEWARRSHSQNQLANIVSKSFGPDRDSIGQSSYMFYFRFGLTGWNYRNPDPKLNTFGSSSSPYPITMGWVWVELDDSGSCRSTLVRGSTCQISTPYSLIKWTHHNYWISTK